MASPSENPDSGNEEPAPGSTFVFSHDPEDFSPPPSGQGYAGSAPPRSEPAENREDFTPPPPPSQAGGVRRPVTARDRLGLIAACVVIGGTLVLLASLLYAVRPPILDKTAESFPSLPLQGDIITVSGMESGWRSRRPADQVSDLEVALPKVGLHAPVIMPQVRFTLDPAKSKTGFLRFIFLDAGSRIAGDVRMAKIVNGRLEPGDPAVEILSPTEGVVYSSFGFTDLAEFYQYSADPDAPRWYVEVSESPDASAGESAWKKLQVFEIGNAEMD